YGCACRSGRAAGPRQNYRCGHPPRTLGQFSAVSLHHGQPTSDEIRGGCMSSPGRTRAGSARFEHMTKAERRASLRLLGTLLKPYTWQLVGLSVIVVLAQLASVAGPAIIAWGIDNGIPALLEGNAVPAVAASVAHIVAAVLGGVLMYMFIRWNMTI